MQVIRYYQQQANILDEELKKTMEPDFSDEETESIRVLYKALQQQYRSSMELAKNDLRIFDTLLDVSIMEDDDPRRDAKIAKYETAETEHVQARATLDDCIKLTMEMMKKIESFNKKKINDKVKRYNRGRCGRKAAMKWIKRRTKERDEIESDRQKVEQTIMSSITKLPPGFSAKINVRRSNKDGDTDEEEEKIPFEESSDDDDETQRIFTIRQNASHGGRGD